MKPIIKKVLLVLIVFTAILWFQNKDDELNNRKREGLYEKYKFPTLVSSIVGLLLTINIDNLFPFMQCNEEVNQLIVISPRINPRVNPKTELNNTNITDQQVFTDFPDF